MERLVDSKCLKALVKAGLQDAAKELANQANLFGAAEGSITLRFLKEDDVPDASFVAEITVTVKRAD